MSELAENVSAQESVRKGRRVRKILIFCLVSLVNLGLLVLIWTQLLTPAVKTGQDTLIGQPAPDFSLAALQPQAGLSRLSLSSFKGKAIVLNFWASWCEPCKEELPLLENAWKQLQAQGKNVIFLGIDFEEASSDGRRFLQAYHVTYPAAVDVDGSVASKYGITGLPQTIFISRNGTVVSKEPRELTAQTLSSNLQLII